MIIGIITLVISFILLIVGFVSTGNSAANSFDSIGNDIINNFNSFDNNTIDSSVTSIRNTTNGMFGSIGLFTLGSFMIAIGFGLTIAGGMVMFIAHRREITAYTTQQIMPVAQEGIEKMSPTIGKATYEIAKGIKQGLNEADKE